MTDQPTGYILFNGKPMAFWLPENVNVDDLGIEVVAGEVAV